MQREVQPASLTLNQAGLSAAAPSKPSAKGLRAVEGIWSGEVSVTYESKKEERRAPRTTHHGGGHSAAELAKEQLHG